MLSSFWSKMAWLPCPTLPIHPISLQVTFFLFPWIKKSPQRKRFLWRGIVERKTAEALKGIRINGFKNCFEQWKKHFHRRITSNGEYFVGDWSSNTKNKQFFINKFHVGGPPMHFLGIYNITPKTVAPTLERTQKSLGSTCLKHRFMNSCPRNMHF